MNKATLTSAWDGFFIREKSHRGVSQDLNVWPHRLCPVCCQEDCDLSHGCQLGGTIWHFCLGGDVNGAPCSYAVHNLHNSTQRLSIGNPTGRKFVPCWWVWKRKAATLFLIKLYLRLDGSNKNSACLNCRLSFSRTSLSSYSTIP